MWKPFLDFFNALNRERKPDISIAFKPDRFSIIASSPDLIVPEINTLNLLYNSIPERDEWILEYKGEFTDSCSIKFNARSNLAPTPERLREFSDCVNDFIAPALDNAHNKTISIEINIGRDQNNTVSLYDFKAFFNWFLALGHTEQLFYVNQFFENGDYVIFESFTPVNPFNTASIYVMNHGEPNPANKNIPPRRLLVDKRNEICNFIAENRFRKLIPDDFHFIAPPADQGIIQSFKRLEASCLISYVFNISQFMDGEIDAKLRGYKTLELTKRPYSQLETSGVDNFFKIYRWIYHEGNTCDKAGLARNIISLNADADNILALPSRVHDAIMSNYDIYLKENVFKYIELKSKLTESFIELNTRLNNSIDGFEDTFQKNLLGVITFFISVFVINSISQNTIANIFNLNVTALSLGFLLLSLGLLAITRGTLKGKLNKYKEEYESLKNRYTDILDKNDIKTILNGKTPAGTNMDEDAEYKKNLNSQRRQIKKFSWFWLLSVVFLMMLAISLFIYQNKNTP